MKNLQNVDWALYLEVNRFISAYLMHLDQEEAIIMPLLWEKCDHQTLLKPLQTLLANMSQQEMADSASYFLPAISPQEKAQIFGALS
jgi:hypothetical protein